MTPMSAHDFSRVMEDVVELRLAREQVLEHRLARLAKILRNAVEELRVADLVLDLGRQGELPPQRRRPHDPLPLREHAHQLAVGVHLDESEDALAVFVGHPVGRLDLAAGEDVLFEVAEPLVLRQVVVERQPRSIAGRQDRVEGKRVGHRWSSDRERSARST